MKITFVTESHLAGDDKKTVDVAKQNDLAKANTRIDALCERFDDFGKRLDVVERRLDRVEEALKNFDARLRDDCKNIFNEVIEESLAPVFAVMKRLAEANGCRDIPTDEDGEMRKKAKEVSTKSEGKQVAKRAKTTSGKKKTAKRSKRS